MAFHLVGQRFRWHSPTKWVWANPCNCCHWWKLARERSSVDCLARHPWYTTGLPNARSSRRILPSKLWPARRHNGASSSQPWHKQWKNPRNPTICSVPMVITSYDLLRRDVDDYAACRFALMALDEAQYIKTMPRSWRKPSNRSPPNTGSH